jgi:Domain of unknown function (DUF4247)
VATVSRNRLFLLAGVLAVAAVGCLIFGVSLLNKDIASYVADHYHQNSSDANGHRFACNGKPTDVADTLEDYQDPEARTSRSGTEYLRYEDYMVIVGPDGKYPCSIRVEDINAGYSHGSYIFLGPGFFPGSPAGGAGGSPGGPDGTK